MNEWLKIALGAFSGISVGLLVQLWKSLRDERRILCDEFCKVAVDAADAASNYWKGGSDASEREAARILAFQRRLDGYRVLLLPAFDEAGQEKVDLASASLFDALTGGDFRSKSKPADEQRASAAQTAAADLVIAVRGAFINGVQLQSILRRKLSTAQRKWRANMAELTAPKR